MNLPGIDWGKMDLKSSCPTPAQHTQFLDILADYGMSQVVDQPTRGENTLDLLVVNNPTLINRVEIIPGISDHDAVFTEIDISPKRYQQKRRKVPIYGKANWDKIRDNMKTTLLAIDRAKDTSSANELRNMFKSSLLQAVRDNIPHRTTSNRDRPPWISHKIKKMINTRGRLLRKMKAVSDHRKRDDIEKKMKDLKHDIRRETRTAYWTYVESIVVPDEEAAFNKASKKLFSFIKHRKSDSTGFAPLKDRGELKDTAKEKAEILNAQFKSVFTEETPLTGGNTETDTTYPDIAALTISTPGIQKLMEKLQPHKAMGPDQLHPRVLKELAQDIAPILQVIFTKSLSSSEVPADWRSAYVTPIYKKGERYLASNYRPVSLTCIASKIMEHIVCKHILNHLEDHNILIDNQHGFRSKRSTETQLISFAQDIYNNLRKNQQTDVIVMDFAKAFDKVAHNRLIRKLKDIGISGNVNDWIGKFLADRKQSVVCEGEMSEWCSVTSGVPQGSVIGPILFLIYINDISENIQSNVRLFADDTILYLTITNSEDCKTLQDDLDRLANWEERWQMRFHPQKCNVIRITKKKTPVITNYHLHDYILEEVDSTKYLGVTIHKSFSWNM